MEYKLYRKRSKMTQEQVAKHLHIPLRTYQNYEYGVSEADAETVCALADLYGVSLDDLFGRGDEAERAASDERLKIISDYYSRMNEQGQETLFSIAEVLYDLFKVD